MSYICVYPVVAAMTLPQIVFGQEERGNTFVFLRALPIRPNEIVAAKYVVSALVTFAFVALLALLGPLGSLGGATLRAAVSTVTLASFVLAAVSYFLHFWLGAKSARVALLLLTFAAAIPMMLLVKMGSGGAAADISARFSRIVSLAGSPAGVGLAFALGLAIFFLSYAASSLLFTRRDLSQLP